jgi:hypothetical protein
LILKVLKLFELHFHILQAVLFCFSGLKIIGHGNPDNESPCISPGKFYTAASENRVLETPPADTHCQDTAQRVPEK